MIFFLWTVFWSPLIFLGYVFYHAWLAVKTGYSLAEFLHQINTRQTNKKIVP